MWGFIVEIDKDEIDVLRYKNRMEVFSNRKYKLVINPTLECNFKCWYCYEKHPQGHMALEVMEKCKKHIQYMVKHERITSLILDWFGGEPILYFEEIIYPIGKYAKKICEDYQIPFYHYITTNASRIDLQMIKRMKEIGVNGFQITIDGDEKRHNQIRNENGKSSFSAIINNINLLCSELENILITLRINYDDQTLSVSDLEKVYSMISPENRKYIMVNFQRVWQTIKPALLENERRIYFTQLSKQMGFKTPQLVSAFNIGKTHKCYVDRIYHAEINYDGKVYRCTARDYSDKYMMGELLDNGEIKWNEEKVAKQYAKATFENDMCLKCKYLPLCMGPCSQKIIETPKDEFYRICFLNYAEVKPETVIIDYYEQKMDYLAKF